MPTYEDIAKIAGVSKATVSLALSDSAKISLETKTKIRNIAKNIGYAFPSAGAARWTRTCSIGILYISEHPSIGTDFFQETLMGISEDAAKANYDVVFIGIHFNKNDKMADEIADKVVRSGVEGIIVVSSIPNLTGFSKLIEMHIPMVFIGDRKVQGLNHVHSVASDNYNGGRMAAEFLLHLGHKNIFLVMQNDPPHWELDRANGFYSALRGAGITNPEQKTLCITHHSDPLDEVWGALVGHCPTAMFAISSMISIRVLHYLRSAGKRVPDDVSLLAFDDFSSFRYEDPPITVIKQDKQALGNLATKIMIDYLENGKTPPKQMLISTQLVERSSCRPIGNLSQQI